MIFSQPDLRTLVLLNTIKQGLNIKNRFVGLPEICFGILKLKHAFHVASIGDNILLGFDFLKLHDTTFDWETEKMAAGDEQIQTI